MNTSKEGDGASPRRDDPRRIYRVLVADLVGLEFDAEGRPSPAEVAAHVADRGASFHPGPLPGSLRPGIHFSYQPDLSRPDEIRAAAAAGPFDALVAAATFVPADVPFPEGGTLNTNLQPPPKG